MASDRRRLILCLATGLAAAPAVQAQAETLRYGGDAQFAPFESLDADGRPRGFQVDLLTELGRLSGHRIEIMLQPWAQTEAAFRAGQRDLIAMVDTPGRREWAVFARGHATPAFAIYHRVGEPDPQSLQELQGMKVAVLDGEAMRATLQTLLPGLGGPFVPAEDARDALDAVRQDRVDVALLPRAYADPVLTGGTVREVVASRTTLQLQSYAFAVPPGREDLRDRLQQALTELERSGRLEALRTQWLSSHREQAERGLLERGLAQQREWTWGIAGAAAVGLGLLGVGLRRRGMRLAGETQARRHAETALSRAEELLARTFTHSAEPMLIVSHGDRVVRDANEALLGMLGLKPPDVVGRRLDELQRHLDAQTLQQLVASLERDGLLDAVPLRLTRPDGRVHDCLVSADRLTLDGDAHVFCLVRDITEQLAHDAELRRGYDMVVDELARAQRELAAARQAQSRSETALQEFTRGLAHDLKTPLNAVQGFVGLLLERLRAGRLEEAQTYGEHIERAAQRMRSMIDALTSLSQVSRQPLRPVTVDMARLARETCELLRGAHPARRIDLRLGTLPTAQGDPDLVCQVWQNLIDNAWKYSARMETAKISIDSFREGTRTWYRVADNGAGFDMAKAGALFQPFQRLHAASQFQGSGVGLSLVRRIVEHHGGEIRLRSAVGVGTVAEFSLEPAASSAVAAPGVAGTACRLKHPARLRLSAC